MFNSFVIGGPVFAKHCVVDHVLATLLAALADLMNWLDATNMPSMVISGVAASVLRRPRLTQDVDALAILPRIENFRNLIRQNVGSISGWTEIFARLTWDHDLPRFLPRILKNPRKNSWNNATLNQLVVGSIPTRPTIYPFQGLRLTSNSVALTAPKAP